MTHMYKFIYIVLRMSLLWDKIWTLSVRLRHILTVIPVYKVTGLQSL